MTLRRLSSTFLSLVAAYYFWTVVLGIPSPIMCDAFHGENQKHAVASLTIKNLRSTSPSPSSSSSSALDFLLPSEVEMIHSCVDEVFWNVTTALRGAKGSSASSMVEASSSIMVHDTKTHVTKHALPTTATTAHSTKHGLLRRRRRDVLATTTTIQPPPQSPPHHFAWLFDIFITFSLDGFCRHDCWLRDIGSGDDDMLVRRRRRQQFAVPPRWSMAAKHICTCVRRSGWPNLAMVQPGHCEVTLSRETIKARRS
jgi:hypothetical protein